MRQLWPWLIRQAQGAMLSRDAGISVAPGTRRHTTPPMAGKDPAAPDCSPARRARVLLPEQAAP